MNDDPGVTLTYFTARSILVTKAFLLEKVKTVDFSVTTAACDLKSGRWRLLIEFMEVSGYRRSRSFFWPWPKSIYLWKLKHDFLIKHWVVFNQILYVSFKKKKWICWYDAGHMTKMAATANRVKTFQKSSFLEPPGRFSRNLACSIGDSCPS